MRIRISLPSNSDLTLPGPSPNKIETMQFSSLTKPMTVTCTLSGSTSESHQIHKWFHKQISWGRLYNRITTCHTWKVMKHPIWRSQGIWLSSRLSIHYHLTNRLALRKMKLVTSIYLWKDILMKIQDLNNHFKSCMNSHSNLRIVNHLKDFLLKAISTLHKVPESNQSTPLANVRPTWSTSTTKKGSSLATVQIPHRHLSSRTICQTCLTCKAVSHNCTVVTTVKDQ